MHVSPQSILREIRHDDVRVRGARLLRALQRRGFSVTAFDDDVIRIDAFPEGSPANRVMRFLRRRYGDRVPPIYVTPQFGGFGGTYNVRGTQHFILLQPGVVDELLEGNLRLLNHELRHSRGEGPSRTRDPQYRWSAAYTFQTADPRLPDGYSESFTAGEIETYLGDITHTRASLARAIRLVKRHGIEALQDRRTRDAFAGAPKTFERFYEDLGRFCAVVREGNQALLTLLDRTASHLFRERSEDAPSIQVERNPRVVAPGDLPYVSATLSGFQRADGTRLATVQLPLHELPADRDLRSEEVLTAIMGQLGATVEAISGVETQMRHQRELMRRLELERSRFPELLAEAVK